MMLMTALILAVLGLAIPLGVLVYLVKRRERRERAASRRR